RRNSNDEAGLRSKTKRRNQSLAAVMKSGLSPGQRKGTAHTSGAFEKKNFAARSPFCSLLNPGSDRPTPMAVRSTSQFSAPRFIASRYQPVGNRGSEPARWYRVRSGRRCVGRRVQNQKRRSTHPLL